jgi:hypothetical protein
MCAGLGIHLRRLDVLKTKKRVLMGPIPLAAHVVNQQAPAAWQRHRPSEGVRLVPRLVGLARLAPWQHWPLECPAAQ